MRKLIVVGYVVVLMLIEIILTYLVILLFYHGVSGWDWNIYDGLFPQDVQVYFIGKTISYSIPYFFVYLNKTPYLKILTTRGIVFFHVRVFLILQTILSLFLPGALLLGLPYCIHLGIGYLIVTGAVALSAFISKRTGITDWLFKHLDTEE